MDCTIVKGDIFVSVIRNVISLKPDSTSHLHFCSGCQHSWNKYSTVAFCGRCGKEQAKETYTQTVYRPRYRKEGEKGTLYQIKTDLCVERICPVCGANARLDEHLYCIKDGAKLEIAPEETLCFFVKDPHGNDSRLFIDRYSPHSNMVEVFNLVFCNEPIVINQEDKQHISRSHQTEKFQYQDRWFTVSFSYNHDEEEWEYDFYCSKGFH